MDEEIVQGRAYWGRPYTVGELKRNPFMDPAEAQRRGILQSWLRERRLKASPPHA